MLKQLTPALLLVLYFIPASASENNPSHVTAYLNNYYELAIQEMHRSGIPASITLAQGILESKWGLSELSINSMNHFGIKCKDSWKGKTFYIEDDDYENGKLMKSCFRVYQSVEDSYVDHTNFLLQDLRYEKLFTYNKTDYENWARGLQSCGYATDKNYAQKLIQTIDKYSLSQYDNVDEIQIPEMVSSPAFYFPEYMSLFVEQENTLPNIEQTVTQETIDTAITIEAADQEVLVELSSTPTSEYAAEASMAYDPEVVPIAVSVENYARNSGNQTCPIPPVVPHPIEK